METLKSIIKETFKRKIFDDNSKKQFKRIVSSTNTEKSDLNFILKFAFDQYRNNLKSDDELFMLDWLQGIVNTIGDLKSDNKTVTEVKFSPIDDCASSVVNFIKSAEKSLFICVFTISDNEISKQILEKHRMGLDIKIITDNEKLYDQGSDIQELVDKGLKIKIDESRHHMHHKFALVDEKLLMTGSYNWTLSAAKYNQENFLILNDDFAIKRYLNEFYRLWKMTTLLHK